MNTALVALASLSLVAGKPAPLPPLQPPPPRGAAPATPPPSSAPAPAPAPAPPPTPTPAGAMVDLVETLYKKQQFESADIVVGKALNSPETTPAERVQLYVFEGMLRMESFQEPQARKAFTEALNLDREAKLPDFAPPATRALFLEVKSTLPAPVSRTVKPVEPPKPRPKRRVPGPYDEYLPWIPIGLGGVALVAGGGLVGASQVVNGSLLDGTAPINSPDELNATVSNGKLYQTAGYAMVGVGGGVLLGGLIWKFAPDIAPLLSVNVAPTDRGVTAVVSGSLP